jgi:hypothetical protein
MIGLLASVELSKPIRWPKFNLQVKFQAGGGLGPSVGLPAV